MLGFYFVHQTKYRSTIYPFLTLSKEYLNRNYSVTIIAPKLYARKECNLAELITPLAIHTLFYSRK